MRRLLAGLLLTGIAAPALASGPPPRDRHPAQIVQLPTTGARVFMRADATDDGDAPSSGNAASMPSPEVAARARAVFDDNRAGKIDRSQYTDQVNSYINDKSLAAAASQLSGLGDVKSFNQVRKITQGRQVVYVFRIDFVRAAPIEEVIAWNAAGKVDFLQFSSVR
ncbi:MAG TPA: hypothetical protein VHT05_02830 [Candidatus Elarobacter sp.]|nr:hypothetical protein [Candidatus Elarobacter sp.]